MKIRLKEGVYNNNKVFIKEVFKKFDLKWIYVKSGWFKSPNSVIRSVDRHHIVLDINGSDKFIAVMKKISESLKAEIIDEQPKGICEDEIQRRINIERDYWISIDTSEENMEVQLKAFERALRKVRSNGM